MEDFFGTISETHHGTGANRQRDQAEGGEQQHSPPVVAGQQRHLLVVRKDVAKSEEFAISEFVMIEFQL